MVKAVAARGASQVFLIFARTKDFITEVEREKMDATLWGLRTSSWNPLLLETAVTQGGRCIYTPVLCGSSEPFEIGSGSRQMKKKMSASLLIEYWEKKVQKHEKNGILDF